MLTKFVQQWWWWLAPLSGVIILLFDRLSKMFFLLNQAQFYTVIPQWLWLDFYLNTNMALSLPLFPVVYYSLTGIVLVTLVWRLARAYTHQQRAEYYLVIAILAGALSNLADRLLYGGVIDFIHIRFGSIFNIADMAIVMAVAYWIGLLFYHDHTTAKKVSAPN